MILAATAVGKIRNGEDVMMQSVLFEIGLSRARVVARNDPSNQQRISGCYQCGFDGRTALRLLHYSPRALFFPLSAPRELENDLVLRSFGVPPENDVTTVAKSDLAYDGRE
jgi:hypothetical protein